jgi:hypothetical protein
MMEDPDEAAHQGNGGRAGGQLTGRALMTIKPPGRVAANRLGAEFLRSTASSEHEASQHPRVHTWPA